MDPIIAIDKDTHQLRKVMDVENGQRCNCVCAECGGALEACQGESRQYFRHQSNDRKCVGSWESQLHLLSKYIIEQNKSITLPKWTGKYLVVGAKRQEFTKIQVEVTQDVLKPDCLCTYVDEKGEEKTLWVEILNTHAVDEEKTQKIKERGVACVEIDVSGLFPNKEINEEVLKEFLLNSTENRHWINNPDGQAKEDYYTKEATKLHNEDSVIKYIDEHSTTAEQINELGFVGFYYFVLGYSLSSKTHKFFYDYISFYCTQNRLSERSLLEQTFFVSAAQFMMASLIQKRKIVVGNDGKGTKEQGYISVFTRSFFCEKLSDNCKIILKHGRFY